MNNSKLLSLPAIGWTLVYILSIVVVNMAFTVLPMIEIFGAHLPIGAFLVGFIFVVRDYAQREVGHWIIPAMLVAGLVSYFMADPFVAVASVAAFLVGEFADWAVYSFTGYPFSKRILLSSSLGTPLDSVVFLAIAGFFSLPGVIVMTLAKMVGAVVVWWIVSRREAAVAT